MPEFSKGLFFNYVIFFRGLEPPPSELDYVIYGHWGIAFIIQKNFKEYKKIFIWARKASKDSSTISLS